MINQKEVKLEMLKRWGNLDEVNKILDQGEFSDDQKRDHLAETYLHNLMRFTICDDLEYVNMWESSLDKLLAVAEVDSFLETTTNWDLLTRFISAIGDQMELFVYSPPMETYCPISLLRVLNHEPLKASIKRGINDPNLDAAIKRTVKRTYQIMFSSDITDEYFPEYYPMLQQFQEYIEPFTAVVLAASMLEDAITDSIGLDYHRGLLTHAIPLLEELTNEETVAVVIYTECKGDDYYELCIKDGVVKRPTRDIDSAEEQRMKEIRQEDRKQLFPYEGQEYINELNEAVTNGDDFSGKFGIWFENGSMGYLARAVEEHSDKYGADNARNVLGVTFTKLIQKRDWTSLTQLIDLPSELIDTEKPELAGLVEAYKLCTEF